MSQHYSDPSRADDPHTLPDVEVIYVSAKEFFHAALDTWQADYLENADIVGSEEWRELSLRDRCRQLEGWYYWFCLPGGLPDSDPIGPFATEQDAVDAAREDNAS
jgi:hypothetical protein